VWQIAGLFGVQKLCMGSELSMRYLGDVGIPAIVDVLYGEKKARNTAV
jgi:hypothetical protein